MTGRRLFGRTTRHAGDLAVAMWGLIVLCVGAVAALSLVAMLVMAAYGILQTLGVI